MDLGGPDLAGRGSVICSAQGKVFIFMVTRVAKFEFEFEYELLWV